MAKPNTISKEKLIQSALTVIADLGIEKLTLKAVAEGAQVTQGTVYYHFKTKDQLLVELVEHICHESWENMDKNKSLDIKEALASAKKRATTDIYYHKIFMSLLVTSFQNENMRKRLGGLLQEENQYLSKQLDNLVGGSLFQGVSNRSIGVLVNALMDGIAIQALLNKDLDIEGLYGQMEILFNHLLKKEQIEHE